MKNKKIISSLLIGNFLLANVSVPTILAAETNNSNRDIANETLVDSQSSVETIPSSEVNEIPETPEVVAPPESIEPEVPVQSSETPEEVPSDSSKPEESTTPSDSSKPEESTTPSDSSKPEESTTPSDSSKPEESTTPSDSSKPEESTTPSDSSKPSNKVPQKKPTKPVTPGKNPNVSTGNTNLSTPAIIQKANNNYEFNGLVGNFDVDNFDFSEHVLRWKDLVETEAKKEGLEDYVVFLLALMQVESGGKGTRDIMQSSESAGYGRNYFKTEEASVRQAVLYLKNVLTLAESFDKGYEKNFKLIAQAYNFGSGFIKYIDDHTDGIYNISIAEKYSLEYVAPSLGNHTGEMYTYKNVFSEAFGKEYLYRNGGNFYYGNIVAALIYQEFAPVLMAIEEFQGQEYVFGGKNPTSGFDCSGLVSWGLNEVGVTLPSYTVTQWENTVPVDPKDAKAGDLIFFRGTYGDDPNFISHIEYYIDDTTMFGSNSSGVGYHSYDNDYWKQHFAGIRRVKEFIKTDEVIKTNAN